MKDIRIIECNCLKEQLIPTISELLKAGHITLVKDVFARIDAAEIITKAGYPCTVLEINKGALFDYNAVASKLVKEESRLVVAIGGLDCIESGKVIAGIAGLPLLMIPTSFNALCCLWKRAEFFCCDTLVTYNYQGSAAVLFGYDILSDKRADIPAAMGFLLAYLVLAFDMLYEGLLHNKGIDNDLQRLIGAIKNALIKLTKAESAEVSEIVIATAADIARTLFERARLGTANSLAWFISLYKRRESAYTDYSFIAAYTVIKLYLAAPSGLNMLLPTDRDMTFLEIEKRCGLSYRQELRAAKIGYAKDYNRRDFVTADYLAELKALLLGDYLTIAARRYRRHVGSCGYNMHKLINCGELLRLAALSSEAAEGYPLIKHLKLSGILDRYI